MRRKIQFETEPVRIEYQEPPQRSYFSQTEVKPAQDSVKMLPTQPRSSSLSKPVQITPMQRPQFVKHLQNTTVKQGNRPVLQCTVKSSPDTDIKWFKNGMLIEPSTDYMPNHDKLTGVCSLTISEGYPQDSGEYTCVATNPVGNESSTAWLVVREPSLERVERQEPFKKTVSTRPNEQARQGQTPLRLGTIESSKVELPMPVEPHKAYPSVSHEAQLPIDPSALTKPRVLEELKNVDLVEGGQALFECRIQGHPLNIQWFKGDRELKNQYRHKIAFDDRTGLARLLIGTVLEDDAGVYTCRASNSIGDAQTSSKLVPTGLIFL